MKYRNFVEKGQSRVSFESRRKALELLEKRLISAPSGNVAKTRQRFVAQVSKLDAMSPLKVLTRGYAMAQRSDGTIIRSVQDVGREEQVLVSLADGQFTATVADVKERAL